MNAQWCTHLGRRAHPRRVTGRVSPNKQSKRRAVKGSAEVPRLQMFPVSFCPCFPQAGLGTRHGLRVVCLIWLEFPPPPTWHAPQVLSSPDQTRGSCIHPKCPLPLWNTRKRLMENLPPGPAGEESVIATIWREPCRDPILPPWVSLRCSLSSRGQPKVPVEWPFMDEGALTPHHGRTK